MQLYYYCGRPSHKTAQCTNENCWYEASKSQCETKYANRTKVIIVENAKKIFSKISTSQSFDFNEFIYTQNDEAWQVIIKTEIVSQKNSNDKIENLLI